MNFVQAANARGLLPDWLLRQGIRKLLRARLRRLEDGDAEAQQRLLTDWLQQCDAAPVAVAQDAANAQHYEVPPEFHAAVLGPHRKYSCGLWAEAATTLADSEAAMLELCCRRAAMADGMRVLDLGCGWGSLTLWLARHFPQASILAVSNSASQRHHIEQECRQRGHRNVEVVTADAATFAPPGSFDRVFSVEMFEHLRNWRVMFARIAEWLRPDGRFFLHVFTHRAVGYPFADKGRGDWMARNFFTGGQMPADSQPLYLQDDLRVERHWRVNGRHYARTAAAWLANLDRNRAAADAALRPIHGDGTAAALADWRLFLLACAELWGFRGGEEWFVSHYLLRPQARA